MNHYPCDTPLRKQGKTQYDFEYFWRVKRKKTLSLKSLSLI